MSEQRRDLGRVRRLFCNDTTHFEKAGALQIAQMVGKALKIRGSGWQRTWPTSTIQR